MENEVNRDYGKTFFCIVIIISIIVGVYFYATGVFEHEESVISEFPLDVQEIMDNIGDPLSEYKVPAISQVILWLNVDETDENPYVADEFMCGEYATELVISAKEENWSMYVVVMYYSSRDDSGYGVRDTEGQYGHAFNMIYCRDGNDLDDELDVWFIEPQSDYVWNIDYGHYSEYTYYPSPSDMNTIWNEMFWINYYLYFN